MKRFLCLAFLLLALGTLTAACGGSSPEDGGMDTVENEAKTPPVSLPETEKAEPVSAAAVVTEGRKPAENYVLPPSLAASEEKPDYDMERWTISDGEIGLLAETGDAAFYGLPWTGDTQTALIRWGDSLAEFDWTFSTPRRVLPKMVCFDIDSDGENELAVACYAASGTGCSIYQLHVLEKNQDGTLTDYALPETLWQEQLAELLRLEVIGERAFAVLGRELVEINPEELPMDKVEKLSAGMIAEFEFLPEEGIIRLRGAADAYQTLCYVAAYTANAAYRDGVFTLSGFHLNTFD